MEQSAPGGVDSSGWLYRHLVEEAVGFALFGVDAGGMIIGWNRGVLEILGYSREEFAGRPASSIFGDAGVHQFVNKAATPVEAGLLRKNGDLFEAEITVSEVTESSGERCGFRVMVRSVTARAGAVCEKLRLIIDQLPFGLVTAAAVSGELLAYNREAVRLLRHPVRPARNFREYTKYGKVHADGTPYTADEYPLARALFGDVVKDDEVHYVRGDGTLAHLAVSAVPVVDDDGNIVAAVSSFQDISERIDAEQERDRLLKELRRSNDDLSQFAHTVSHDLQAPLRTLRSFTDLLTRRYGSILEGSGAEFIRFIAEGAARMDDLVQALLRYARAGEAQLNAEDVDTAESVSSVLTDLATEISDAGAAVHCENLPRLSADAVQLDQLFQNLIGNALKYARKHVPPVIGVSAVRHGAQWSFTVADNGTGIPHDQQDRIFLPLKRLHGLDVPGSGMGLAICRRIVQRHGGHIWVESVVGEGSRFCFTLPALPE